MKEIDHKPSRRSSGTFQTDMAGKAQEPSGLSLPGRELPQDMLDMPITELAKFCNDPVILLATLDIAYQQGCRDEQQRCHKFYHMMLTGQDEASRRN